MKITINLSEAEVRGLKKYLKATEGAERPGKKEIAQEIISLVSSALQSPRCAVSDYIKIEEQKLAKK